jgi:pentatricopeptide repeat protein
MKEKTLKPGGKKPGGKKAAKVSKGKPKSSRENQKRGKENAKLGGGKKEKKDKTRWRNREDYEEKLKERDKRLEKEQKFRDIKAAKEKKRERSEKCHESPCEMKTLDEKHVAPRKDTNQEEVSGSVEQIQDEKLGEKRPRDNGEVQGDRGEIRSANDEIAKHASRKSLNEALGIFEELRSKKSANSHSYAAILNACVRCGDTTKATELWQDMRRQRLRIDVIPYTTMIKGYCADCNMPSAIKVLEDMNIHRVPPNIRTMNTLLRGAVMTGEVLIAEQLLTQMKVDYQINADISSFGYTTSLFCQSLLVDKVLPMIGRLKGEANMSSGMAHMYTSLSHACALLGSWKLLRKSLKSATESLQSEGSEPSVEEEQGRTILGGKRAWKDTIDESRQESLELYREHKKGEIQQELDIISAFCEKNSKLKHSDHLTEVLYNCRRVVSVVLPTTNDARVDRAAIVQHIADALKKKFGIEQILKALDPQYTIKTSGDTKVTGSTKVSKKNKKKKSKDEKSVELDEGNAEKIDLDMTDPTVRFVSHYIDENGQIDFKKMFQCKDDNGSGDNKKGDNSGENEGEVREAHVGKTSCKPVKMEICSGAGEWAVSQAAADPEAQWVTLELRHDRVYQTITKSIYAGTKNMCVMAGDAMRILPHHISDESLDVVCVNHPEPPQQRGGKLSSQSKHLLMEDFFDQIERTLKPNGVFTVVTDNLWYGQMLMKDLAERSALRDLAGSDSSVRLRSMSPAAVSSLGWAGQWEVCTSSSDIDAGAGVHEDADSPLPSVPDRKIQSEVVLYVGKPGPECGHMTDASSYFDRLWKRGNLDERYFIVLRKCAFDDKLFGSSTTSSRRPMQILKPALKPIFNKKTQEFYENGKVVNENPKAKKVGLVGTISTISSNTTKIKFDE